MKDVSSRKKVKAMETTITLDKTAIYTEVKKLAGYSGKKQTDATDDIMYEVMHITKEEEEMLDQFWHESVALLMDILKPFVKDITSTNVRLEMPKSWDINMEETLQSTVNDLLTSLIATKWFRLNNAKNTELEKVDADQKMLELRRKLYWKRKPTLK